MILDSYIWIYLSDIVRGKRYFDCVAESERLARLKRIDAFERNSSEVYCILHNSREALIVSIHQNRRKVGCKSRGGVTASEAASVEAGLITLMKEQLAKKSKTERGRREAGESALVPSIFLAAPLPFFILRRNKTRVVRAGWLISSRQFVKRAANKRDKNTREK